MIKLLITNNTGEAPHNTSTVSETVSGFLSKDKLGSPQIKPLWMFFEINLKVRKIITAKINQHSLMNFG